MDHIEVQTLIDAYVDDELDLLTSLAIERHLQDCGESCPTLYQRRLHLRTALKAESLYFRPSTDFRTRIQASLPQTQTTALISQRRGMWVGLAAGLVVVLLGLGIFGLARGFALATADVGLSQQVVASHLRSLMAGHLTDVASSDQHTVKPWFDGKLDFAPTVIDLADQGFPLIGGRLDFLDNRPVAALIYQYEKHVINLFIWPSTRQSEAIQTLSQDGYSVIYWTQSNMNYWAVSDLESSKLDAFVQLLQSRVRATPAS